MTEDTAPPSDSTIADHTMARTGPSRKMIGFPRKSSLRRARGPIILLVILAIVLAPIIVLTLRPKEASKPAKLAAIVNGLPVTFASYQRQLQYATAGYTGPGAPGTSLTGQTVARLLEDRAIQQAIAEALIDNEAAQQKLSTSSKDVDSEVAAMTKQAGGPGAMQTEMRAAGMTADAVRSIARYNILRSKLATVLHDPAWLDHLVGKATVQYFVSDGAAGPDNVPAVSLGHPAPPFVATDLLGRAVSLADLQGRVVVLNFWASWCGYCVTELPMLLTYARAHPSYYVIALNHGDDRATAQAYVEAHHLQGLTVWLDGSGDAFANYEMTGLPATFFIDKNGYLRSYNYGALADAGTLADQARLASKGLDNTIYNQGN
jgi:cytochrome c biogenesis protein CcmG/thiol:disulfide interchange protein DsbE